MTSNPFWAGLSRAVTGEVLPEPIWTGAGPLPSVYAVEDFAAATIGLAGAVLGSDVQVDRRRASLWFDMTLRPQGWELPSAWDAIAGVYKTRDGWIRLHTNAPHHREAALGVLACSGTKEAVAEAVQEWHGDELEQAIVEARGCAAVMYSAADWHAHPQGQAVAKEPLVIWDACGTCPAKPMPDAGLSGIKILDLTRVLAGPVATRFLAGFGADVLRIDPPTWSEPGVEYEVTLGKRCAGLDLRDANARATLLDLIAEADVLVHGYRADALEVRGLGEDVRYARNPSLIDVRLNAYGWSGPWRNRRGFDSLVQMSCGIAATGQAARGTEGPSPLPVQALDHGTGYLMAACVIEGLKMRSTGQLRAARLSLARTAQTLMQHPTPFDPVDRVTKEDCDFRTPIEETSWGPAQRVTPPLTLGGAAPHWAYPAGHLRRHAPQWTGTEPLS